MKSVPPKRRRELGFWMCTALVVGNMVGSGIFLLPASLAPFGGISLLGWVFTACGALLLGLVFARLARLMPKTGGLYAFSRKAYGDFIGFLMAWGYWLAICAGNAAIAVAFVGYLSFFFPDLSASPVAAAAAALTVIWSLTAVNVLGVREAGFVQLLTVILKLLPLAALGFMGVFFVDLENFTPFNASDQSAFGAIAACGTLTLWAFMGLESGTVPAEHVKNPEQMIPRATVVGTMVAAVVYICGTAAVMGLVPNDQLRQSTAPFAEAAGALWGEWAGGAVALGALISTFGALNGWILVHGQIPLAAARDGLFPKIFGNVSSKGTPAKGLFISSAVVTAIVMMNYTKGLVDQFTFIILLATLTTLVPYLFCSLAEIMIRIKGGATTGMSLLWPGCLGALAFLYSLWAVGGSGKDTVFYGFILLMSGIPVYVWLKVQRTRQAAVETPGARQ